MTDRTLRSPRIPGGTVLIRLREFARRLRNTERHTLTRLMLKDADIQPSGVALVIGVRDGSLVAGLASMVTSGFVAGIDAAEANVRRASRRNRAGLREGRIELLRVNASEIPYPDSMFDVVFAHERAASSDELREIFRVIRPGGLLLLGLRFERAISYTIDENELAQSTVDGRRAALERSGYQQVEARSFDAGAERVVVLRAVAPKSADG